MKEDIKKAFVNNLRAIMNEKGIAQNELAEKIGVNPANVCAWYNGTRYPRAERIEAMAQALGVNVEQLQAGGNPDQKMLTHREKNLVRKYRTLDDFGRESVDLITDRELRRVYELNAAHAIAGATEEQKAADNALMDWE